MLDADALASGSDIQKRADPGREPLVEEILDVDVVVADDVVDAVALATHPADLRHEGEGLTDQAGESRLEHLEAIPVDDEAYLLAPHEFQEGRQGGAGLGGWVAEVQIRDHDEPLLGSVDDHASPGPSEVDGASFAIRALRSRTRPLKQLSSSRAKVGSRRMRISSPPWPIESTRVGPTALASASRGIPSNRAISPRKSPRPRVPSSISPLSERLVTRTWPSW